MLKPLDLVRFDQLFYFWFLVLFTKNRRKKIKYSFDQGAGILFSSLTLLMISMFLYLFSPIFYSQSINKFMVFFVVVTVFFLLSFMMKMALSSQIWDVWEDERIEEKIKRKLTERNAVLSEWKQATERFIELYSEFVANNNIKLTLLPDSFLSSAVPESRITFISNPAGTNELVFILSNKDVTFYLTSFRDCPHHPYALTKEDNTVCETSKSKAMQRYMELTFSHLPHAYLLDLFHESKRKLKRIDSM